VELELRAQANQSRCSLIAPRCKTGLIGERHVARGDIEKVRGDCLACRALVY
jgi:hypothetical protein